MGVGGNLAPLRVLAAVLSYAMGMARAAQHRITMDVWGMTRTAKYMGYVVSI